MTRKNESPQKVTMRKMMKDYLSKNNTSIRNSNNVNSIMRDMNVIFRKCLCNPILCDKMLCRVVPTLSSASAVVWMLCFTIGLAER